MNTFICRHTIFKDVLLCILILFKGGGKGYMPKILITVSDENLWKLSGEGINQTSLIIHKALEEYFKGNNDE